MTKLTHNQKNKVFMLKLQKLFNRHDQDCMNQNCFDCNLFDEYCLHINKTKTKITEFFKDEKYKEFCSILDCNDCELENHKLCYNAKEK